MYRVIIADDEPWAVYRIRNLIAWESMNCEIVGTAGDGLSALEMIREKQPDILFSDIRMPGLDGLQLIREMKTISPHTLVILISGYSDFSYAQEALRQGVFDYLVKPVRKNDLTAVLEQAARRLSELRSPWEEHDLFFSLFDSEHPRSAASLFTAFDCKTLLPRCCLITAVYDQALEGPLMRLKQDTLVGRENQDTPALPTLSLRTGIKQMSILLQPDQTFSCADSLTAVSGIGNPLYVGVSMISPADTDFALLLRQSKIALLTAAARRSREPVFYSPDIPMQSEQILAQFSTALRSNDQAALTALIDRVEESAETFQMDVLLDITNRMTGLLCEYRYGGYEALEMHHWQQLTPENPIELLISPLRAAILQQKNTPDLPPTQFRQILNVIETDYMHEIRLTDVAKRFYLSANYLSILIKRETGLTFSELLIQKRIALARKLLAETNLPIQDIMEQVGYKDYSCFIKLFKKHTGYTPYAYRKVTESP
ncbi:MAG: response regulator [Lachnospiraceae bacterium]|nr:response regulator [Lachnospiraceae bacterium]